MWNDPDKKFSVYVGYDPRELQAFLVARETARRNSGPIPVHGLILNDLRVAGLYRRPTSIRDGRLHDEISDRPMSTEFALTRFLVPHMANSGWALFMDCDMMIRSSLYSLFQYCAEEMGDKAVVCVKHTHVVPPGTKMDGQVQEPYIRKNWSSFMMFNVRHPSNKRLTTDYVNSARGLDLHQFRWLDDHEIGELPVTWNYLVGFSKFSGHVSNVHFTEGIPSMAGHENDEYADEWREELLKAVR